MRLQNVNHRYQQLQRISPTEIIHKVIHVSKKNMIQKKKHNWSDYTIVVQFLIFRKGIAAKTSGPEVNFGKLWGENPLLNTKTLFLKELGPALCTHHAEITIVPKY